MHAHTLNLHTYMYDPYKYSSVAFKIPIHASIHSSAHTHAHKHMYG